MFGKGEICCDVFPHVKKKEENSCGSGVKKATMKKKPKRRRAKTTMCLHLESLGYTGYTGEKRAQQYSLQSAMVLQRPRSRFG